MTFGAIVLTAFAVFMNFADAWTTSAVRKIGIDTGKGWREANPIARFLFRLIGYRPYLLKALVFVPVTAWAASNGLTAWACSSFLWFALTGYAVQHNYQILVKRRRKYGVR